MSLLRVLLRADPSQCQYYRRGAKCSGNCWEEPYCIVDEPACGWPLARLRARGREVPTRRTS